MQNITIQGLKKLSVTYRTPMDVSSDQGIHFIGHEVQE